MLFPWTEQHLRVGNDALGRQPVPLEFKVLAVLRVLGRALHFDDLAEITHCGEVLNVC